MKISINKSKMDGKHSAFLIFIMIIRPIIIIVLFIFIIFRDIRFTFLKVEIKHEIFPVCFNSFSMFLLSSFNSWIIPPQLYKVIYFLYVYGCFEIYFV